MKTYIAIEQIETRNERAVGSFAPENKWTFSAESREDALRQVEDMNRRGHAIKVLFTEEEYYAPTRREPTERETLRLRGNDRIEGGTVVLAFKHRREVRMTKAKWIEICKRSYEPHTIAALSL